MSIFAQIDLGLHDEGKDLLKKVFHKVVSGDLLDPSLKNNKRAFRIEPSQPLILFMSAHENVKNHDSNAKYFEFTADYASQLVEYIKEFATQFNKPFRFLTMWAGDEEQFFITTRTVTIEELAALIKNNQIHSQTRYLIGFAEKKGYYKAVEKRDNGNAEQLFNKPLNYDLKTFNERSLAPMKERFFSRTLEALIFFIPFMNNTFLAVDNVKIWLIEFEAWGKEENQEILPVKELGFDDEGELITFFPSGKNCMGYLGDSNMQLADFKKDGHWIIEEISEKEFYDIWYVKHDSVEGNFSSFLFAYKWLIRFGAIGLLLLWRVK